MYNINVISSSLNYDSVLVFCLHKLIILEGITMHVIKHTIHYPLNISRFAFP